MADNFADKIPNWIKSLWDMENELRSAAQKGVFLKKDEASNHLAEARRHLDEFMGSMSQSGAPTNSPSQPPTSTPKPLKDGEI